MFELERSPGTRLSPIWKCSHGSTQMLLLLLAGMLVALALALALGVSVAGGDYMILGLVFGVSALVGVLLLFRTNIWLLMLLLAGFSGKIGALPIPFTIAEMGTLLAFGMYLIAYAMKAVPKIARLNNYDLLLFINLAYVATLFIRNPVGTAFTQSDMVGGRPYYELIIALMGYFVLQHVTVSGKLGSRLPILLSLSHFLQGLLGALTTWVPGLGRLIFPFYTAVANPGIGAESLSTGRVDQVDQRQGYASGLGMNLGLVLSAYFSPLQLALFLKLFWSLLFYVAFVLVLLSGFRSKFVVLGIIVVICGYFRDGPKTVIIMAVAGLLGYVTLAGLAGSGAYLPQSVHRTMSFLPGPWDSAASEDAFESNQWRLDMWRDSLKSERYIRDKFFGDGFGFSMSELQAVVVMILSGEGDFEQLGGMQEYFLVIGMFHSGPLSAIRVAGYLGLLLILALMISLAVYAWKLIKQSKDSPFFPLALFVGAPLLWEPFDFILVYGDYGPDMKGYIFSLAILNLCSRSLAAWQRERTDVPVGWMRPLQSTSLPPRPRDTRS